MFIGNVINITFIRTQQLNKTNTVVNAICKSCNSRRQTEKFEFVKDFASDKSIKKVIYSTTETVSNDLIVYNSLQIYFISVENTCAKCR